jgi:hypothetical protein
MPFTFSHPAAILPLNWLPKKWLSLTGLVVGSITPDFEYFARMKIESKYSHTWIGLFWFDLPLAILLMFIYTKFIKDKLIDHLPEWLNSRLSAFKTSYKAYHYPVVVIVISILIGAGSHLFWDDFTHPTGYFVLHIHALKHHVILLHHKILFYNIVQHLSSIIGAIIVIAAIWRLPQWVITTRHPIIFYWLIMIMVTIIVLLIRFFTGLSLQQYGDVIVTFISGLLIGLLIASLISPRISLFIKKPPPPGGI